VREADSLSLVRLLIRGLCPRTPYSLTRSAWLQRRALSQASLRSRGGLALARPLLNPGALPPDPLLAHSFGLAPAKSTQPSLTPFARRTRYRASAPRAVRGGGRFRAQDERSVYR